jgi:hypothetical protein
MSMTDDEKAVQGIQDKGKRKEAFYTLQRRRDAEHGGNEEYKKVNKKLGFGGIVRGEVKDTLDSLKKSGPIAGMFAAPEFRAAKALGGAAKALMGGKASGMAKRAEGAVEGAYQRLKTPTPVKKALGSGKKALGSGAKKLSSVASKGQKVAGVMPPKPLSGGSTKALPAGKHSEFEAELAKQSKKKMPVKPKTFNRNGSARAEGRQKSDRNHINLTRRDENWHKMNLKSGISEKDSKKAIAESVAKRKKKGD